MIEIPEEYRKRVISEYGTDGSNWLNRINELVEKYKTKFKLSNMKLIKDLSINIVFSAYSEIYGETFVKFSAPGKFAIREINFITSSHSKYIAKCHYYNLEDRVMILEKITPGTSLKTRESRTDRIHIFCEIVNDLLRIEDNAKNLYGEYHIDTHIRNLEKYESLHLQIDEKLAIAEQFYHEMSNSNLKKYVLHRDLHHGNILKSNDGWKVIDPHGLIGYRVFELTQFIRVELEMENLDCLQEVVSEVSEVLKEDEELIYKALYIDTVNKILHYLSRKEDEKIVEFNNKLCERIMEVM